MIRRPPRSTLFPSTPLSRSPTGNIPPLSPSPAGPKGNAVLNIVLCVIPAYDERVCARQEADRAESPPLRPALLLKIRVLEHAPIVHRIDNQCMTQFCEQPAITAECRGGTTAVFGTREQACLSP